jgi:hypothetical protein
MSTTLSTPLSRRAVLQGGLAAAAATLLAGCTSDEARD